MLYNLGAAFYHMLKLSMVFTPRSLPLRVISGAITTAGGPAAVQPEAGSGCNVMRERSVVRVFLTSRLKCDLVWRKK